MVIDLLPSGAAPTTSSAGTLVKTDTLEVVRLVVPAGAEISTHHAPGEITLQCLEGRVACTTLGRTHELEAGQLLFLAAREFSTVRGIEDASLLVTLVWNPG